jgi:hypothetical protein
VIEAEADVQGQPGGDAPVILDVELGIPIDHIIDGSRGGLAVTVDVSE